MNGPFNTILDIVIVEVLPKPLKKDPHIVLSPVTGEGAPIRLDVGKHTLAIARIGDNEQEWAILTNNQSMGILLKNLRALERIDAVEVARKDGKGYFDEPQ